MFERHKPLLSLHLCASVLLADDQINRQEYAFLFTHGGVPDSSPLAANPDPEWITPAVWQLICKADQLEGLQGLQNSIEQNIRYHMLTGTTPGYWLLRSLQQTLRRCCTSISVITFSFGNYIEMGS